MSPLILHSLVSRKSPQRRKLRVIITPTSTSTQSRYPHGLPRRTLWTCDNHGTQDLIFILPGLPPIHSGVIVICGVCRRKEAGGVLLMNCGPARASPGQSPYEKPVPARPRICIYMLSAECLDGLEVRLLFGWRMRSCGWSLGVLHHHNVLRPGLVGRLDWKHT